MERFYKIAGLTVQMDTFGRTEKLAEPYLCPEGPADLVIRSDREGVQAKNPTISASHCEYLASGASFYQQLMAFDGLLLHAAAVVVDGKAYLFTAPRKTGKSTHVQLWLDAFGDRALILNEDKPALRRIDGKWYAFGTPWSGKTGLNKNMGCPLAGICLLERNQTNSIAPYVQSDIVFRIMKQTYRPKDALRSEKILTLIGSLLEKVPVWRLKCNMEPEAAYTAWEAMTGNVSELRPKE